MEIDGNDVQSRYWVAKSVVRISANVRASSIAIRLYYSGGKVMGGEVAFALSAEILETAREAIHKSLGIPELIWNHLARALGKEPSGYLLLNYSINESSIDYFGSLLKALSRKEFKDWLEANAERLLNLEHLTWRHARVERIGEVEN